MTVVFSVLLKRADDEEETELAESDEDLDPKGEPSGLPTRRLAAGALVVAAVGVLGSLYRRRRRRDPESDDVVASDDAPRSTEKSDTTGEIPRLRRVGKGWIRR